MIINWDKNGNKCLSIGFDKLTDYNIFRIQSNTPKKGVNSYYEKNVWVFGFKFTYIDLNYNDIICIKLKTTDNYTASQNSHEINVLKETLTHWVRENIYFNQKPAFNWNYLIDDNNEITFFITGEKQWFIDNKLGDLVNAFKEIVFDENEYQYFPKYNPTITNKVLNLSIKY